MTYRVIMMPRAEDDLARIFEYMRDRAPRAAEEWLDRARQSIESLAHHPGRCPLAPESVSFEEPIRELLFGTGNRGTYRFLFVLLEKSVYILHVRHGSMRPLDPDELE
jgi:plasmid stabilization system protein ParE